jgi:hypothetical protein
MWIRKQTRISGLSVAVALAITVSASAIELTTNGDFELGDFTGWTQFPTGAGQQTVTSVNPSSGTYAGEIFNVVIGSNSLMKQANLAAGALTPFQSVNVSFDARGMFGPGGIAFAELFSELTGGGTSKSEILSGGPLVVNGNPEVWTNFAFTTTLGPDVSGGLTLQLGATTGAFGGSTAQMWYDNVSVTVDSLTTPDPNANFDGDVDVDGADFLIWQGGFGATSQVDNSNGDADFNGTVAAADLSIWQTQYGSPPPTSAIAAIPEPTSILLLGLGALIAVSRRRRIG